MRCMNDDNKAVSENFGDAMAQHKPLLASTTILHVIQDDQ